MKGIVESATTLNAKGRIAIVGDSKTICQRDEHAWTSLIRQHTKCGQGKLALKLYEDMRQVGVEPSSRTFVALLQACCSLHDLERARCIHVDVIRRGLESDLYVGTMLVDVYAKCMSLVDARCTFEKMPHRDVVSWTAMILAYAQMNDGEEALNLFYRMQQEGVVPSDRAYIAALKACCSIAEEGGRREGYGTAVRERCLKTVRAIHREIVESKLESGVFVATMLLDAYGKCASLNEAREVFDKMPQRSVVSWNAMILGYAQWKMGEEGLKLYNKMYMEGIVPDDRTYVSALKACSSLLESDQNVSARASLRQRCFVIVRAIHSEIVKGKFRLDAFVGNMLIDVYSKCGSLDNARYVFDKMPHRNVVSWNAMIWGYAHMHKGEDAVQLYTRMQSEAVTPNDRTYVSVLKACSTFVDSHDRTGADHASARKRCLQVVRSIHANVRKGKCESDVYVGNILVDAYAKCGSLEDARSVFEAMPRRTVVTWTAMIFGYVQMDESEVALHLFTRMQQEGVVPNHLTFVGALNACGSLAGLEEGRKIHAQIVKAGLDITESCVTHSLIDMYGKCGCMVEAQQMFDALPSRANSVAWNALISGYAHIGQTKHVFDLFYRMTQEGIQPDAITFLGVLIACSHAGLVDKGKMYFTSMTIDYGITPSIKHFTCMVDLLGRSGQLDKAMELVKSMPFEPDSAVWECLLGACRKWGDVELGRRAFEWAVMLNTHDAVPYVLMSNIYAAAHLRNKANEIHTMRMQAPWAEPMDRPWRSCACIRGRRPASSGKFRNICENGDFAGQNEESRIHSPPRICLARHA